MWFNLKRLWIKSVSVLHRVLLILAHLPVRLYRLMGHLGKGISPPFIQRRLNILDWWVDFFFFLVDLIGLPEVVESIFELVKWNTRSLSPEEKKLVETIFGHSIDLDKIRIDDKAMIGCKKRNIAYVSFHTVNSWGALRPETLIHELVHVWQYQKLGGAYIPEALRAQRTKAGYNYGGVQELKNSKARNGTLDDFNLEQQAEIVADCYAIRSGKKPVWGKGTIADLPVYEYFVAQIRK